MPKLMIPDEPKYWEMSFLRKIEKEKRRTETHPDSSHLRVFPFKCPSCEKTDIFWVNDEDFLVCSNCQHIWLLAIVNPSKRKKGYDLFEGNPNLQSFDLQRMW